MHDKYVVAWYCEKKADVADAASARVNIGGACLDSGYNECYNRLALKAVNKYRSNHNAPPLKLNLLAAQTINVQLQYVKSSEFRMPDPNKRGVKYTGCFQSVFLETGDAAKRAKVSSTSVAVDYWYNGIKSYDYNTNASKVPTDAPTSGYTSEPVGCLQSVLLAYDYDTTNKKYRSLETRKRQHSAAYHATDELDCQKDCDLAGEACVAFETGAKDAEGKMACKIYQYSTAERTSIKAELVAGTKCFVKNEMLARRRSTGFENMVWKSAETVAFGVNSPWVVAWYCSNTFPATLKARNAADRKANVLKTQIVNGYNSAYNQLALAAHNQKRSAH